MWNRHDVSVMAVAALATFSLTVCTFLPRVAGAVDQDSTATANIKVPTLTIGRVSVTAALDTTQPRTFILTLCNSSDEDEFAPFSASASVTPEVPAGAREEPIPLPVWTEEYSLILRAHETKTIAVTLPEKAFVTAAAPAQAGTRSKSPLPARVSGGSFVTLTSHHVPQPQSIVALTLPRNNPPSSPDTAARSTAISVLSGPVTLLAPRPFLPPVFGLR